MDDLHGLIRGRKQLMVAVQLVSLSATAALMLSGWASNLETKDVEAIGGSLTMALLFLGLMAHVNARRGRYPAAPLALLGVLGPAYAALGGKPLHVASYHLFVLAAHYLVWTNLNKAAKSTADNQDQADQDDAP